MDQVKVLIDCDFKKIEDLCKGLPKAFKDIFEDELPIATDVLRVNICRPDDFSSSEFSTFYRKLDTSLGELVIETLCKLYENDRYSTAIKAAVDTLHAECHEYIDDLSTYYRLREKLHDDAIKAFTLNDAELDLLQKIFR